MRASPRCHDTLVGYRNPPRFRVGLHGWWQNELVTVRYLARASSRERVVDALADAAARASTLVVV
eukprot:scaffold116804_cov63-Phaeocystis_antarctica.AAC.2